MNASRRAGRPRKVTDEAVKRLLEWKPLTEVARELGISAKMAYVIRGGRYSFKQPSP
jgi:hypothetical protein